MFCDRCPHNAKIAAALAPCQTCGKACFHGGTSRANVINGGNDCGDCPHLKEVRAAMRFCANCEAGKLSGQVSTDASEAAAHVLAHALPKGHTPTDGVTKLPPAVEDAVRKMLFVLFDFSPIELLLLQHVAHGRNVGTFREPLAKLKDRLNLCYDLSPDSKSFRACAHLWKKSIVEKLPALADLFDAINDANAGSCRR